MRPLDPRVRGQIDVARRPLSWVVGAGALTSGLIIAQAFAMAALVVAVVEGSALIGPAIAVAAIFGARAAVSASSDLASARAAALVAADMRRRVALAVLRGDPDRSEGELTALATRGVSAAEPYLTRYVPALVLAGVLPLLTVAAMATQDVMSAVIVLATLPLLPVFGALVGLATRDRAEAQWRAMSSLSGHFVDVMRGLPTLVAFRRARAQSATIRAVTNRYRQATVRTLRIAFASSAVLELVATLSVALVAVVVGVRLADGGLDLRTGLVVLLLAPEAYWPLRRVGAEFHAAAEGVATFETMSALTDGGVDPATGAVPAVTPPGAGPGMIAARSVSFTYPGRRIPVVRDLDLVLGAPGLTALAGPSGCGKSTVLALLAGLLEPTEGEILVAGSKDRRLGRDWQRQVAWIPQRPSFLPGSVAENLRLAAPDAADERLWDALAQVALADRVRALGGLEAPIGEDGRLLSAGERARLALARAVASDRPWVFLDEPTAHLDPVTKAVMIDVLAALARERGVLVVAHDREVLAAADRVVELPAALPAPAPIAEPGEDSAPAAVAPATAPQDGAPARFGLSTTLGVLASSCGVALTATAGWLIVKASEQPAVLTMLVAIVGVRTFGLGRPVFRYAERLRSHDGALRMLAERRVAVYDQIVPLTPGRLGKRRGDVLASIVDDVDATVDRELRVRLPLRTYAAVAALAVGFAAWLLPLAGAWVALTSVAGAALGYAAGRWGSARPERESVAARAELSAAVLEAAQLAPELTMWQAETTLIGRVDGLSAQMGAAIQGAARGIAAGRAALTASVGLGVLVVAAAAHDGVAAGAISAPMAALLVLLPLALGEVAAGVVDAGALTPRVRAAEDRLAAYGAMSPAVTDPEVALAPGDDTGVRLREVELGWAGRAVLTGLDLDLAAGERLAVIGPSGCGKTTLACALIRFVDPMSGSIELGSRSLGDLALDEVRGRVGLVDDDPHVFSSTVAENVRLARPGATDAEVAAALSAARLDTWLADLPHGLDTWLGDGHARVSGGERARLGLARSLLADQPVLVLDEPVAHLDRATAESLAADLLDGAGGRSVVWITHSDVGLERMDRVLELT